MTERYRSSYAYDLPEVRERMKAVEGRIVVFTDYYPRKNSEGQVSAIAANLRNPLVAQVVVYHEAMPRDQKRQLRELPFAHSKITLSEVPVRLNMTTVVRDSEHMADEWRRFGRKPPIVVLVNADCSFDATISNLAFIARNPHYGAIISRMRTVPSIAAARDIMKNIPRESRANPWKAGAASRAQTCVF